MKVVLAIAALKFRELIRERVFYVAIAIAIGLLGISIVFGSLTFAEQKRILADFGLAGIEWALMMMSIFIGAYSLPREFERQTCLIVLSRPVSRFQFLLGIFLGISSVLVALGVSLFAVLYYLLNVPVATVTALAVLASIICKVLVLSAIVILLSLIVRPVLATAAGFTFYLLGHWIDDLRNLASRVKNVSLENFAEVMSFLTPNFFRYNWKAFYFLQEGVPSENITWMLVHTAVWLGLVLALASYAFRRKQIV